MGRNRLCKVSLCGLISVQVDSCVLMSGWVGFFITPAVNTSRLTILCQTFYNWKLLFTAIGGEISFRIHCTLFGMHSFPVNNGDSRFT